jgi:hypothetical protein
MQHHALAAARQFQRQGTQAVPTGRFAEFEGTVRIHTADMPPGECRRTGEANRHTRAWYQVAKALAESSTEGEDIIMVYYQPGTEVPVVPWWLIIPAVLGAMAVFKKARHFQGFDNDCYASAHRKWGADGARVGEPPGPGVSFSMDPAGLGNSGFLALRRHRR